MSYSASSGIINKHDIASITVAEQTAPVGNRSIEHIVAAKDAARIMARAIGLKDDQVSVSISGHANIDGSPVEGWADEFMSITVHQRREL